MSILSKIKTSLTLNSKNIIGWKTRRKLVAFSVDDYGNVRVDSKKARAQMDKAGMKILSRFDSFDALENREDLEQLFEVLRSVKDKNGRNAIFTPFAIPVNIDFEKMAETGYKNYYSELLPDTFSKLRGYEGTWDLWKEGISQNLFVPQFHGREHFNVRVFQEALDKKDPETLTALKNRSYTSITSSGYDTISTTAAYEFWDPKEVHQFEPIVVDGIKAFEKVFGYPAVHFNAPGAKEHPQIHRILKENGIKYIDTAFITDEHQGFGKYTKGFYYTGKRNPLGQLYIVRNVVFEPTDDWGLDWVSFTMKQIETAFRWNRPAIISSHRVNFCGHIDSGNRNAGLKALRELLQKIVEKWPDVEFMSANEVGDLIDRG